MRSRWLILALLCALASLLAGGIASAHAASGAENRVWGFDLAEQIHVGGQRALTPELHQGYELAEYDSASGSLLAARGGLKWPPNRGFAGKPRSTTLQPGTRIDRYGSEAGTFTSPAGTPFGARSLPSKAAGAPLRGYEVVKPLPAQSGAAAPWFGQPGGGMQYELGQSVKSLVDQGFLRRIP